MVHPCTNSLLILVFPLGSLLSPLVGHSLQFELAGLRSYRIRTYRIIYRIHDDESCLDIVFIGPRRNVYEELRTLLLAREKN
ncbi:type II toxin-antitoxin system RelE family toxin [Nitrospira sp. BLG_2]|uniref:type II toxin-antitoxin system RelE family toxin n=1 Tax=Nitrospira sp. BLG_2 TaxID=3397507 RepID=UPI003B9D9190